MIFDMNIENDTGEESVLDDQVQQEISPKPGFGILSRRGQRPLKTVVSSQAAQRNNNDDSSGDFVPVCNICGEKHWPFHPLVPCTNINKAKNKAKAKAKAEKKVKVQKDKKVKEDARKVSQLKSDLRSAIKAKSQAETDAENLAKVLQETHQKLQAQQDQDKHLEERTAYLAKSLQDAEARIQEQVNFRNPW